jgi:hypothetical protein
MGFPEFSNGIGKRFPANDGGEIAMGLAMALKSERSAECSPPFDSG